MNRTFWIWLLAGAGLGLGFSVILQAAQRSERVDAHAVAEARLDAVERASIATLPGTQRLAVRHPENFQGARSVSGPLVTYARFHRRRHDLTTLPMDDARGGPVAYLLELARLQARELVEAGFQPMVAEWSTTGREGIHPHEGMMGLEIPIEPPQPGRHLRPSVYVGDERRSPSGGGGGKTQVNLNAPWITHYRIYLVPNSGATLFVRNRFDNTLSVVDSEFAYSDRTLFGVEYPQGSHIVGRQPGHFQLREWIVQPD